MKMARSAKRMNAAACFFGVTTAMIAVKGPSADDADGSQIQDDPICAHLRNLRMVSSPPYGRRRFLSVNRGPELTAARPLPPACGRGPEPGRDDGLELADVFGRSGGGGAGGRSVRRTRPHTCPHVPGPAPPSS